MKWWRVAAAAAGLACGAALAADPVGGLAAWSHAAPVQVPPNAGKGIVEAALPAAVLSVAREDLSDLRLVDGEGNAVPYVVRDPRPEISPATSYPPSRLFDATFIPGKSDTVTADFGEKKQARTRIDVQTPGTNFKRQVRVEASSDGTAWQVLRQSAWLFRVEDEGRSFEKRDVSLPDNDFRFLRITVWHAADDSERVPIESVTAWHVSAVAGPEWINAPVVTTEARQIAETHTTEMELDLGAMKIPVRELRFTAGDSHFLRPVEVLGRNIKSRTVVEPVENDQPRTREVPEPWELMGQGTIYRLPEGGGASGAAGTGEGSNANLNILATGAARYVLLRIWNKDDQPLTITGVTVRRAERFIDFRAPAGGGTLQLYVGNPGATTPEYDLAHFADALRAQGVTAAWIGMLGENRTFAVGTRTIPWSERHRVMLWAALLTVLVILAGLVIRQANAARAVDRGKES